MRFETENESDVERTIQQIEIEIAKQPRLTEQQQGDIRAMYGRIRRAFASGDHDEARRAKALCMKVISQGPPAIE